MATKSSSHSDEKEIPLCINPDDPGYIKDLQRPAVIKEDLTEMERRKRVQELLKSKSFCEELEEVIRQDYGNTRNDSQRLKRLSVLKMPKEVIAMSALHRSGSTAVTIADLKNNRNYSGQEKMLRNKLACLYRLVDLFQWSLGVCHHITLRLSGDDNHVLVNPLGLPYNEMTAGSLVKVNLRGDIVDAGTTKLGINKDGFILHSAIHCARADIRCILHINTAVVSAVAAMRSGLLPLCHEAMIIGSVAYHDNYGSFNDKAGVEALTRSLGNSNVILLRDHGFIICGGTVEGVLHLASHIVISCEAQIRAARAGVEHLFIPDGKMIEKGFEHEDRGQRACFPSLDHPDEPATKRAAELEWEAWMRVLDHAGSQTGHIYRKPFLLPQTTSNQPPANTNGAAIPPTSTNTGPWIRDTVCSPSNGVPDKINVPLQRSPVWSNSQEYKDKQRTIKADFEDSNGRSAKTLIIGTASKGIIDRQHHHTAQVYRQLYPSNPFTSETEEDIKKYMQEVNQKSPRLQPLSLPTQQESSSRSERSLSPYQEEPGADTASLMQAARMHTDRNDISASSEDFTIGLDKRAEDTTRAERVEELAATTSARVNANAREDEVSSKSEKKKKKSLFSFMKTKDKSSKA